MLVLSGRDVRALLPYAECADVMRAALTGLARGDIQQPLRTVVRPDGAAGFMGLMPSYAADPGYGLKAICITPGNPARGLDTHQGGVLLFAPDTGEPLALVNASALTEVRTAAVSAVATDLLAGGGATEVAIIGTGVQGFAHARALAATRPGCRIRMAGRTADWADAVRAEADALGVTLTPTVRAALDGAAIVVTATTSQEPVLRREWLAPGTHVNAVGACVPTDREIDTATMADAAIFADRRDSLHNEAGDFLLARRDGAVIEARAELGELLTGTATGRRDDTEITVFKSLGLAAEDLAAAGYVYRAAVSAGAGTTAEF
ncbi:MAG TPA: ornithine cyclodeaminase family protein [Streptosporangiaceae bacterium]|nr:ornithine cyclodeaminase family protein [Streptosporangiaceae bacterium]